MDRPPQDPGPDLSFLDPPDGPPDALAAVLHDGRRRRRTRRRALEVGATVVAAAVVLLALAGITSVTGGLGGERGDGCAGTSCAPVLDAPGVRGPVGTLVIEQQDNGPAALFWLTADVATTTPGQADLLGEDGVLVTDPVGPGGELVRVVPAGRYEVGRWASGRPADGERLEVTVPDGGTVRVDAADVPR